MMNQAFGGSNFAAYPLSALRAFPGRGRWWNRNARALGPEASKRHFPRLNTLADDSFCRPFGAESSSEKPKKFTINILKNLTDDI